MTFEGVELEGMVPMRMCLQTRRNGGRVVGGGGGGTPHGYKNGDGGAAETTNEPKREKRKGKRKGKRKKPCPQLEHAAWGGKKRRRTSWKGWAREMGRGRGRKRAA